METIGTYGNYTVTEAAFEKTFFPEKVVGQADDGTPLKESVRVNMGKRVLILSHKSGDKVAFQISRFGKRVTYKDSRNPKKPTTFENALAEVVRMLEVDISEAAALLRAA